MIVTALLASALVAAGCKTERQREAERQRLEQDRNSAAFKAGQKAHQIAKGAEKAATAAGRKLEESARKAREGWKEQERQEREKRDR